MNVAFLGNFKPRHSSENHFAESFEALGHTVLRLQEGEVDPLAIPKQVDEAGIELVTWVQTYDLATRFPSWDRRTMRFQIGDMGIPVIGLHLDRWIGLAREDQVRDEPFFECTAMFTADGGHQQEFASYGVNHFWMPPGVVESECYRSQRRTTCPPIVFVGAWQHYAHAEWWPYRRELIERLTKRYGRRFGCYPKHRGQAIRGAHLNALYSSARIVIGDSCLAGGATHYLSDRVPESIGRGGFLIHPRVEGVIGGLYEEGIHLQAYGLGDWDELFAKIDHYLRAHQERETIRAQGLAHVKANHTYRVRMREVLETLVSEGLLRAEQVEGVRT